MSLRRLPLALALSVTILSLPLAALSKSDFVIAGAPDVTQSKAEKKAVKDAAREDARQSEEKAKEKDKSDKEAAKETKIREAKEKEAKEKVAKDKDNKEKKAEKPSEEKGKAAGDKKEARAEEKAEKKEARAEARAEKKEAHEAVVFMPDNAFISILKDVDRILADSQTEQVAKIEDVNQKMILGMAQEIFSKALGEPNLKANRILAHEDEHSAKAQITAESWSSGDVEVSDKLRGSLAAVWAKRIGGLLTVTIAGDAGARKTPDGNTIGQFMVVLTGHSPVQKGFDIQSQGDVTFWMGKLNNIAIEANCVPVEGDEQKDEKAEAGKESNKEANKESALPASSGEAKKKLVSLSPLLTDRYRSHYALLLAADSQAQKVAEELAAAATPDEMKAEDEHADGEKIASAGDEAPAAEGTVGKEAGPVEAKNVHAKLESKSESKSEARAEAKLEASSGAKAETKKDVKKEAHSSAAPAKAVVIAAAVPINAAQAVATLTDSGPHFHMPSMSSTLLMPDKAMAGQYVTVAMLDRSKLPEANVELSFNGASFTTDAAGQAVYQIPEDTTPGRSLNIALSARPDEVPATIEVFQALNMSTGQAPRLDRISPLAVKGSIMTVEGHNFDGQAHNNTVIVDGSLEGRVISSSPFQIKLLLPENLSAGPHSLCISTEGTRSNLAGFDFADTAISVDGRDSGKENSQIKLVVKVVGTTAKMNIKIVNQTPDIISLNRGAEMTMTSSGGFDNTVVLPAMRSKKGAFKIDTQLEM